MKQVIALLASACLSWQAMAQHSLSGTVTDNEQQALAGAHVQLNGTFYQTVTNTDGLFVFRGLKDGEYAISVSFVGFETIRQSLHVANDLTLNLAMKESATVSDAVIVSAVRASRNTPTTFATINREEIERQNLAQDLPYMLANQASVVTTSDAGAGVGYTGLRIRGTDMTRINVTINGIPLNDPESHAVYWVDVPDIASSVNSLQIQRGVGSSTNGAGAFGASMNLETAVNQSKPYGLVSASAGSYGTYRTSFQAGTGIINNHWYFEGRGSSVGSDGYIDRASSALTSFFMQAGYSGSKTLVKAMAFGGSEKTYQAWYGIDGYTMETDRTFNWAGAVFDNDGTMWFYKNQTDNYKQNHYQLHLSHQLTKTLTLNVAGHYTYGRGYYEEYVQDQAFNEYGLDSLFIGGDTVSSTDLIRRRWLDNHYYGTTWSLRHKTNSTDIILGGSWNKYDNARHYGEIIWADFASNSNPDRPYYDNTGHKSDFNSFVKAAWMPIEKLTLYGDLQYRHIAYQAGGIESHLQQFNIDERFDFVNPKVGVSFDSRIGSVYASYAVAHREPIRDDYVDAAPGEKPEPEILGNLEVGLRKTTAAYNYAVNYFLMNYRNQLVLTGALNDDGEYIRKNAGKSYRTGAEITGGFIVNTHLQADGNLTLMTSRTDYRDTDAEGTIREYNNTDISFSPQVIGSLRVRVIPIKKLSMEWQLKHVGRQFLDNTENSDLKLDAYTVNDLRARYLVHAEKIGDIEFNILINNVFNVLYESNGYAYDGSPYYYPQAGTNVMAGFTARF
jgi:iron complex outermembrane receptor protein